MSACTYTDDNFFFPQHITVFAISIFVLWCATAANHFVAIEEEAGEKERLAEAKAKLLKKQGRSQVLQAHG